MTIQFPWVDRIVRSFPLASTCGILPRLASLTHTPSPMTFLNEILGRPANERPYLILVTGSRA